MPYNRLLAPEGWNYETLCKELAEEGPTADRLEELAIDYEDKKRYEEVRERRPVITFEEVKGYL